MSDVEAQYDAVVDSPFGSVSIAINGSIASFSDLTCEECGSSTRWVLPLSPIHMLLRCECGWTGMREADK